MLGLIAMFCNPKVFIKTFILKSKYCHLFLNMNSESRAIGILLQFLRKSSCSTFNKQICRYWRV